MCLAVPRPLSPRPPVLPPVLPPVPGVASVYIPNPKLQGAGANTVSRCSLGDDGTLRGCSAAADASFSGPAGIAFYLRTAFITNSAAGTVTACEADAAGVLRGCRDGAPGGKLSGATGIAIAGSKAYIALLESNSAAACDVGTLPDGRPQLTACRYINGPFTAPFGVAVRDGRLFVTNLRGDSVTVCALGAGGDVGGCVETAKRAGLRGPAALAFAPPSPLGLFATKLYIANTYSPDASVSMCDVGPTGLLFGCATAATGFSLPAGVAVFGGKVYVTNLGDGSVRACAVAIDAKLTACETVGTGFAAPQNIAFLEG